MPQFVRLRATYTELHAFDVETGTLVYEEKIAGVCGLAVEQPRFTRSTENGEFGAATSALAWDNHITRLV